MNTTKTCPTFLLEDAPAEKDAFGPHQRVADAIVELITSHNETGGKAIGLEGGWGSGKSTVVRFITDALAPDDNYQVVLFDAWSHEGDPLRRTCIESIIKSLQRCGWLNRSSWDNTLQEIAKRRKESTTSVTPSATWLGTILAISIFLVPVGTALMSPLLKDGVVKGFLAEPGLSKIVAALCLAPFVVLLGNLLRVILLMFSDWFKGKERRSWSGEWSFVVGESVKETKSESFETPNPTSIEFQQYFENAMQEALGGTRHKERQIVLVLDNLDRVEPDSASAIWSTLQTFVQRKGGADEDHWFSKIWVLVPYDPTGIRKLWDSNSAGVSNENESLGARASNSFLDKSFQIRFQVPPPVLSDWKSYLFSLVELAMPNHGDDCHDLYRVFEHCRAGKFPPTPRQLKLFVNQIGAIHRQWAHEFSLGHVAYFVAESQHHEPMISRLMQEDFPSAAAIRILDDGLKSSLAGLAFNVEAKKGMELLLSDSLHQSLVKGAGDELVEVSKVSPDGFWPVLEKVVSTKFDDASNLEIADTCKSLGDSDLLMVEGPAEVTNIKARVKSLVEATEDWLPFQTEIADGLCQAIKLIDEEAFTANLLVAIKNSVATDDNSNGSYLHADIAKGLVGVIETATSLAHEDSIPEFELPCEPKHWVAVCDSLASCGNGEILLDYVRPSTELSDIDKHLADSMLEPVNLSNVFRFSRVMAENYDWNLFLDAAETNCTTEVANEHYESILTAIWQLKDQGVLAARATIKNIASSTTFLENYGTASSEGNDLSIFVLTRLISLPIGSSPQPNQTTALEGLESLNASLASQDDEVSMSIVRFLKKNSRVDHLLEIARNEKKVTPIVAKCLGDIANGDNPESLYSAKTIDLYWATIRKYLGDDSESEEGSKYANLLRRLVKDHSLCRELANLESGFNDSNLVLYWQLVRDYGKTHADFCVWCKEGVEAQSKEAWLEDMNGNMNLIWLALIAFDAGQPPTLTTHFADAMQEYSENVISGNASPEDVVLNRWGDLMVLVDNSTRIAAVQRLLDMALERDGDVSPTFIKMFGAEFEKDGMIGRNENIVSQLFSPLLRKRNQEGISWLIRVFESDDRLLSDLAAMDNVDEFTTRIQDCLNTPEEDDAQGLIETLGSLLGLEPPLEEDPEEAEEELTPEENAKES